MLWAVIMAGGSGTRFWPESRKNKPKQFLKIFGHKTLLEQTADRVRPLIDRRRILVVTQASNVPLVVKLLKIPASQVIGEPVGRNTAPCAALAAAVALRRDPEAVLAILPSDHRIDDESAYRKALRAALEEARARKMPVTFGIRPAYPHTGFGYLEFGRRSGSRNRFAVHVLKRFCEKPGLARARSFVRAGRYYWNSGMFVWRADELLRATREHQPKIHDLAVKIASGELKAGMKKWFSRMPSVSIDYGLMERIREGILAIPGSFGWNDLGGWQVLPEMWTRDAQRNVVRGRAILIDSFDNIVKCDRRLVALVGVRDQVVVDTPDALLVCHRNKTESVRHVVAALEKKKWKEFL
ncbi:MAG: sugar phosphate nucleotidyltransferase [Candidatus Omnitrophota bacterium]